MLVLAAMISPELAIVPGSAAIVVSLSVSLIEPSSAISTSVAETSSPPVNKVGKSAGVIKAELADN